VKHFKDPKAARTHHRALRRAPDASRDEAKIEGMRTMAIKLALHQDMALAMAKKDAGIAARIRARSTCSRRS